MATATATTAAASATSSSQSSNNSPGPTSSPLLFFVALGFGVVFTNLWIIVGVKYCFRYNQRNRALRNGEDGEPIDLNAMPRAHRRRREKKLMTMDEVNERFPLTKYKDWMTTRAAEGLPTAGGIAAASSRPTSIKNEEGIIEDLDDKPRSSEATSSTATRPILASAETTTSDTELPHGNPEIIDSTTPREFSQAPEVDTIDERPGTAKTITTHTDAVTKTETNDEGDMEDDEDQIQTAVPAEQLPDPGDACAICLDTIEEDDDIRGLTCGHAFHASCVDPWLTSRRACCPLCKADYYVPKPRPEGADTSEQQPTGRRVRSGNMPASPQYTFISPGRGGANPFSGRRPNMVLPGRFMTIVYHDNDRYAFPTVIREARSSRTERDRTRRASSAATRTERNTSDATTNAAPSSENRRSGWRQRLANIRLPYPTRSATVAQATGAADVPSPAQLEAGRA